MRSAEEYPAEQLEGTAYHIPKNEYPNGFDLQWCAVEVWQQPQPSMWNEYHRMGWEPVLAGDFDGMYDGRFLPREHVGEIKLDGLILCARPMSWSIQAREKALREARGQVSIKVAQLRRGDLDGVTLDSTHKSALAHNTIGSEFEGIRLPAPAPDK